MCGRYTITKRPEDIRKLIPFRGDTSGFKPRFNLAPTQKAPVITMDGQWHWMRWGLIPSWAKDAALGAKMINARSETVAVKPAFKRLLTSHRCLVPADGFYEWKALGSKKQPYYCQLNAGALFCFAGLWDRWRTPTGEEWETFTLLTAPANAAMQQIHHRMPVILDESNRDAWIQGRLSNAKGSEVWHASLAGLNLTFFAVHPRVNRAAHDAPDCLEPLPAGAVATDQSPPPKQLDLGT